MNYHHRGQTQAFRTRRVCPSCRLVYLVISRHLGILAEMEEKNVASEEGDMPVRSVHSVVKVVNDGIRFF